MSVSVVMLGDAYAGKSLLAQKLVNLGNYQNDELAHTPTSTSTDTPPGEFLTLPYRPTVGADRLCGSGLRYQRANMDLTIWDYPGNERLQTVAPSPKVSADVCLLVLDCTNDEALDHLDAWHDEYLHMCCTDSIAPPMFVVALTKCDAPVERRKVDKETVARWCAREYVDPTLWPRDVVGQVAHCPPVVEVSAIAPIGLQMLFDAICHRGLMRQSLSARLEPMVMDATRDVLTASRLGASWCCAVVGEVRPLPIDMYADTILQRVDTDSGELLAWNAPYPMLSGNTAACRVCHAAIINVKVSDNVSLQSIRLWQEVILREGHIRDIHSVAWIVVGWHTSSRTVEASMTLSQYCEQHRLMFSEIPIFHQVADCDRLWSRISAYTRDYTEKLLLTRSQEHGGCGTQSCPNAPCPWIGRADALDRHHTICEHFPIRCRYEGCFHTGPRGDREEHEKVCAQRPPSCHFCQQAFHGSLYEHLLQCSMRGAYEETHVPCPMAGIGCTSTLIKRGEVKAHIDSERVEHVQLLAAALARQQNDMLEQDRRHRSELENIKEQHARQTQALMGEIVLARAVTEKQHDSIKDLNIQLRLMWEELDQLKASRK